MNGKYHPTCCAQAALLGWYGWGLAVEKCDSGIIDKLRCHLSLIDILAIQSLALFFVFPSLGRFHGTLRRRRKASAFRDNISFNR